MAGKYDVINLDLKVDNAKEAAILIKALRSTKDSILYQLRDQNELYSANADNLSSKLVEMSKTFNEFSKIVSQIDEAILRTKEDFDLK